MTQNPISIAVDESRRNLLESVDFGDGEEKKKQIGFEFIRNWFEQFNLSKFWVTHMIFLKKDQSKISNVKFEEWKGMLNEIIRMTILFYCFSFVVFLTSIMIPIIVIVSFPGNIWMYLFFILPLLFFVPNTSIGLVLFFFIGSKCLYQKAFFNQVEELRSKTDPDENNESEKSLRIPKEKNIKKNSEIKIDNKDKKENS